MNNSKTVNMVMSAMLMALTLVATMFIKIYLPVSQGYVHFGDTMVILSALILGRKYGAAAGGIGAALADILGGFAIWAPWTFVIKALMVIITGTFAGIAEKRIGNGKEGKSIFIIGIVVAGAVMVVGYYLAECVLYGNPVVALLGIHLNAARFLSR